MSVLLLLLLLLLLLYYYDSKINSCEFNKDMNLPEMPLRYMKKKKVYYCCKSIRSLPAESRYMYTDKILETLSCRERNECCISN